MLQILQINLQHSIKASASLLLLLSKTGEDVVLIQEPWILKSLVRGLRTPVYYVLYVTGKVIKTSPQTTIPTGWYQHIWATTTRAHCLVPYHTTWGSTDINDRGKYEFSMGTHIIFEENPSPQHIDPIYEKYSKKTFQYLNKTNKVLNFSRIFVESENNTTDTTIPDNITINKQAEKNPLIIDMTYEEALKKLKHDQN
ncbi:uncharacterized protein LOC129950853 isoform X1 [Eupeodes corollae]|uniref:uncharacterized protein LOC129950853 isoform X1 n=1 Tax=Eupeodes corollae TaxID=290404 RepID=UPI0024909801|nr:uncharacterized protein LOC129950853 isoform X1 [Eupeodes corollae]